MLAIAYVWGLGKPVFFLQAHRLHAASKFDVYHTGGCRRLGGIDVDFRWWHRVLGTFLPAKCGTMVHCRPQHKGNGHCVKTVRSFIMPPYVLMWDCLKWHHDQALQLSCCISTFWCLNVYVCFLCSLSSTVSCTQCTAWFLLQHRTVFSTIW